MELCANKKFKNEKRRTNLTASFNFLPLLIFSKIDGYLEDYSYFANALLDVFEILPNSKYLDLAISLGHFLIDHFWDDKNDSFFMTSDSHEDLIIRPKSNYDLSLPSGNSVSCSVLLRLFHLTQENNFLEISKKIMESQAQLAAENPFGFGFLLNTIYAYLQKPIEITVLNNSNKEIPEFLAKSFIPESILISISDQDQLNSLSQHSFFAGKKFVSDITSVFVCRDFTCSLPLHTVDEVKNELGKFFI